MVNHPSVHTLQARTIFFRTHPQLRSSPFDSFLLLRTVLSLGGWRKVGTRFGWTRVLDSLKGFSYSLKESFRFYEQNLKDLEGEMEKQQFNKIDFVGRNQLGRQMLAFLQSAAAHLLSSFQIQFVRDSKLSLYQYLLLKSLGLAVLPARQLNQCLEELPQYRWALLSVSRFLMAYNFLSFEQPGMQILKKLQLVREQLKVGVSEVSLESLVLIRQVLGMGGKVQLLEGQSSSRRGVSYLLNEEEAEKVQSLLRSRKVLFAVEPIQFKILSKDFLKLLQFSPQKQAQMQGFFSALTLPRSLNEVRSLLKELGHQFLSAFELNVIKYRLSEVTRQNVSKAGQYLKGGKSINFKPQQNLQQLSRDYKQNFSVLDQSDLQIELYNNFVQVNQRQLHFILFPLLPLCKFNYFISLARPPSRHSLTLVQREHYFFLVLANSEGCSIWSDVQLPVGLIKKSISRLLDVQAQQVIKLERKRWQFKQQQRLLRPQGGSVFQRLEQHLKALTQ